MVVERGDITHIIKIGQVFPLEASDVVIPVGGIRITFVMPSTPCIRTDIVSFEALPGDAFVASRHPLKVDLQQVLLH
jgi:hypothetical protein